MPGSVEVIEDFAVLECSSLYNVIFPSISQLRQVAACFGFTSVAWMKVPKSVPSIDQERLSKCSSLREAAFPSDSELEDIHGLF
jgi:hypothetical protein